MSRNLNDCCGLVGWLIKNFRFFNLETYLAAIIIGAGSYTADTANAVPLLKAVRHPKQNAVPLFANPSVHISESSVY